MYNGNFSLKISTIHTYMPNSTMATVVSIGTATPSTFINQVDYPDFFFRTTNSEHLTALKQKFTRICSNSGIKKRHLYVTEDLLKEFPALGKFGEASLQTRLKILAKEVPKLGMEAALKAIAEWGEPKSRLSHLIFCTTSDTSMPSADYKLAKLLNLSPSTKRLLIHSHGCSAGLAALRLAKDIAESDTAARVLIVCSENTLCCFHAPRESHMDMVVGSAIFGDGASAIVVGADLDASERPKFQVLSANQATIPDSEEVTKGYIQEMGYMYNLSKLLPCYIRDNVEKCVKDNVEPYGITDLNSLFYAVHPGGPSVLNAIEKRLCLTEDRLNASRHVLSEYGNMVSPTVFFVLDHMRKRSLEEGKPTTGDGKEFGVMMAFGPGITVETIMLRSVAT